MADKALQTIMLLCLILVGLSALLSIRAHYMVWRYSPLKERLPRSPDPHRTE